MSGLGYTPRGGEFATSQRGGLTQAEIREIEVHRQRERPTPWSALAKRYARCEADIRALFDREPENDNRPAPDAMPRESRDEAFTRMWKAGMPLLHICTALNINPNMGKHLRSRLALPPRPSGGGTALRWTPEMDAVVRREYIVAGHSADTVAKTLGVSRNSVIGRASRLGYLKQTARAA